MARIRLKKALLRPKKQKKPEPVVKPIRA